MTRLLIDGDVIAYRAGFATEKTKYLCESPENAGADAFYKHFDDARAANEYGGMVWSRKELEPEEKATTIADVMISEMRSRFAVEAFVNVVVCLSGVGNYRTAIATRAAYKGNREGSIKPRHHKAIVKHLELRWNADVSHGEEADDRLGILATENPGSIIASIDKDLLQIPGRHYNFVTKEETTITPKQGVLNFYAQVLSGDPVDNVLGLTGIGPVKAKKLLDGCKSPSDCWKRVVDAYKAEFKENGERFAMECARLVFLRRKVGEMWQPPAVVESNNETPVHENAQRRGEGRIQKRA